MELPFTIVFEPPSRKELRALLRMRGYWVAGLIVALTIGAAYVLSGVARADAGVDGQLAPLSVTSEPGGASVLVDGRQRGVTPVELAITSGTHAVVLKGPGVLDRQYSIDLGPAGAAINSVLWRRQPVVTHLRPALPGAALTDVRFLEDDRVGLSIALPPGQQVQAWRLDPSTGALEAASDRVDGSRLVFSPDGNRLAYLGSEAGPAFSASGAYPTGAADLSVVWMMGLSGAVDSSPLRGWRPPLEPGEQLVDLAWSPLADRLLVISGQSVGGGARASRLWLLDPASLTAQALLNIPSDVVTGTLSWSPDSQHAAFVAHSAQVNALCLLGVDGTFRYLADLDLSDAPLPYDPGLTWSADGQRMLFVAPHQHMPGVPFDWLQPDTQHAVYQATLDQPMPVSLTDTPAEQVTWRDDGQVLALVRAGVDSPLTLRLLDGSAGSGQQLLDLPLKAGALFAATWDLAHANLVIASRNASSRPDFWLVRLGEDGLS